MSCDPSTLLEDSRCFRCLPEGTGLDITILLLCEWINGENVLGDPDAGEFLGDPGAGDILGEPD